MIRYLLFLFCICSLVLNGCNSKVKTPTDNYYGKVYNEFGLIAVQGQYYDSPEKIFEPLGYEVEVVLEDTTGWDAMKKHLDTIDIESQLLHCVWEQNGFTVVEDKNGLMATYSENLHKLSDTLGVRVFAGYNQKITGFFSFSLADDKTNREIVFAEGAQVHVEGKRLPQEKMMDLTKGFDFEELYTLLKNLGFDWFETQHVKRFKIIRIIIEE